MKTLCTFLLPAARPRHDRSLLLHNRKINAALRCRHSMQPRTSAIASVTGQLADATGDFARLVFVLLAVSARPRVDQSASPRVGVSASCPVTLAGDVAGVT